MFSVFFPKTISFDFSELGSENLRTMIYIIQSYILLAPEEFIASCGSVISVGLQVILLIGFEFRLLSVKISPIKTVRASFILTNFTRYILSLIVFR